MTYSNASQNCIRGTTLASAWISGEMRKTFLSLVAALMASALIAGCGTMQARVGTKPDIQRLNQSLQIGSSTEQDVRSALGLPDGQGRSMLPWQTAPRTVWTYYYEEGVINTSGGNSDDRRLMLFVFLNNNMFDGYMWFSSLSPPPR